MAKNMEAPFVFGVRVEGDAFTYGGGVETSRSHTLCTLLHVLIHHGAYATV